MNHQETVSVIIPVYNGARFVAQAIDSVLWQSYRDFEVVVVDDGSTDMTRRILSSYRNYKQVRCLYQNNAGPATARNTGIHAARGRYIAFLDADDQWLPQKLARQVGRLRGDPGLKVVHSNLEVVDVHGSVLPNALYDSPVREGWVFDDLLLLRCWMQLSTLLVDAAVLDRVGVFNESLRTAEDTNLFLRIAHEYRIGFVDNVLVRRRSHGMNLSETDTVPRGTFKNLDDLAVRFPELRSSALLRQAYERRYYMVGCTAFREGNRLAARQNFRRALKCRALNGRAALYFAASYVPQHLLGRLRNVKRRISSKLRRKSYGMRGAS